MLTTTLLTFMALLLALPVAATASEYCQFVAKTTETFAELRDNGKTPEYFQNYEYSSDGATRTAMFIVDTIFTYPMLTPREEANRMFEDCMDKVRRD